MPRTRFEAGLVRYFVDTAAYESARSLALLRAIEKTVQLNSVLAETFSRISHLAARTTEDICNRDIDPSQPEIDFDGSVSAAIDFAMENISSLSNELRGAYHSAKADGDIRDGDGVLESFEGVIAATADAHNGLNELNRAVMEHDADRSPLSGKGPFRTVDDLLAALT